MNILNTKEAIISNLLHKVALKQKVIDETRIVLEEIKKLLPPLVDDYNKQLKQVDENIFLEYTDRGAYECQLKLGSDVLFFSMHSNVFQFNREHKVWSNSYLKTNTDNSYSGTISIYNFLADSLKFNRHDDYGYLVARVFINRERHFIVEGKRQMSLFNADLSLSIATKDALVQIIETAMNYSINFDLLVTPYDAVKVISLAQMEDKIQKSRVQTGKRLGFQFKSDDV